MLVYAWNHPHEKNFISVTGEDEKDLVHLLSKVLINKVKALIKKGFYKEYVEQQEVAAIIRGKILFKESFQTFSHKRGKLHTAHEDMSYDILHNQLIKTTLSYLASMEHLRGETQDEIRKVLSFFEGISLIKVTSQLFNEVNVNRNNQHYRFILHICQFICEHCLLREGKGEKQFQDVSREHQQMAKLFENFVKNFYRAELPGSIVKSESLLWPAEGENIDYLPKMTTDISLEHGNQKIIIDTKFYKEIFGQWWNKESIRSGHLYQLFAYLKNDEYYTGRKAAGILLYPKVNKNVDLHYQIHGFLIRICTLDLAGDWRMIHERLLEMAAPQLGKSEGNLNGKANINRNTWN